MITVKIHGDDWKCFTFTHDEFIRRFKDNGISGWADIANKQILFVSEDLTLSICRHEVFHAFVSYLRYESADLTNDQLEEVYCELFAVDGPKMMSTAKKIFEKLRELE